jgi:hypothetical protein
MPTNTDKYFSCIYCGAEFTIVKSDDIHTKPIKIELIEMILKHYITVMSVAKIIKYIGLNNKDLTNFSKYLLFYCLLFCDLIWLTILL